MRPIVTSALLAALIGVVSFATFVPLEGFWITDDANRYLQTANFAAHGRLDIVHPGARLDPGGRHVPLAGHHFQRRGGRLYSFYPFAFPILAWPGYALTGIPGLYLFPLLGFAACAALLASELRRRGVGPRLLPWLAPLLLCATPLVFYALVFWEHTLATALFTGGMWLALHAGDQRHPGLWRRLGAGAILGGATVLREEGYVLTAAFALGWVVSHPGRRAAVGTVLAGWVAIVLPWWMVNLRLFGNVLGLHASVYAALPPSPEGGAAAGPFADVMRSLWVYLLQWHPDRLLAIAGALPLVLAAAAGLLLPASHRGGRWLTGALALATAGSALLVVLTLLDPAPLIGTLHRQSLLPGIPIAALVLIAGRRLWGGGSPVTRCLLATSAAGVAGLGLGLRTADMGIIWGPRHFLMLVPALLALTPDAAGVVLGAATGRGWKRLTATLIAGLVGLGLLLQAHGLGLLSARKRATRDLAAAVAEMQPVAVVTDVYWVPEELAAIYLTVPVFDAADPSALVEVLDGIRAGSPNALVVLALSPSFSRLRETDLPFGTEIVARLHARAPRVELLELVLYAVRPGAGPCP